MGSKHVSTILLRRHQLLASINSCAPSLHKTSILSYSPLRLRLHRFTSRANYSSDRAHIGYQKAQAPSYALVSGVEKPCHYVSGGLHPVNIGDVYKDRYRIIDKLGYGSFSTTWLARDLQHNHFVALKMVRADAKKDEAAIMSMLCGPKEDRNTNGPISQGKNFILSLIDEFTISGPNGKHVCIVSEAAACNLSAAKGDDIGGVFKVEVARALAAQLCCAVAYTHSRGIVHGDLHMGNILLRLPSKLNQLTDKELYDKYGHPEYEEVVRDDGLALSPGVPAKLVVAAWLGKTWQDMTPSDANLLLSDFGASFSPSDETRRHFFTPTVFRPPEAFLEPPKPISFPSDVWTLACSIWDIVAWRSPFDNFFGDEEETMLQQVDALGPTSMPDSWWNAWKDRGKRYKDRSTPSEGREPWRLERRFESSAQQTRRERGWEVFSPEEAAALMSLMRQMLAWKPEDRPTMKQVLESKWMQDWALPGYRKLAEDSSS